MNNLSWWKPKNIIWLSILLLSAITVEKFSNVPYLSDGEPQLGLPFLLRTLFFFAWSLLFVVSLNRAFKAPEGDVFKLNFYQLEAINLVNGVAILFLGIFLLRPQLFSLLALEDSIVENLSSLFCFLASFISLASAWKIFRISKGFHRSVSLVWILGFSLVLFLIGMEEVSWFQRVFDIQTPEALSSNLQNELNLHNISTTLFENAYYLGSFVFCILLPLLRGFLKQSKRLNPFSFLLPGALTFYSYAIATAYNYDMWNRPAYQIAFAITICSLILFASETKDKNSRLTQGGLILLMAITQTAFLLKGNLLTRNWDITEFKEFFIPLSLLAYAVELQYSILSRPKAPALERELSELSL